MGGAEKQCGDQQEALQKPGALPWALILPEVAGGLHMEDFGLKNKNDGAAVS